jgi:hypothetical protein
MQKKHADLMAGGHHPHLSVFFTESTTLVCLFVCLLNEIPSLTLLFVCLIVQWNSRYASYSAVVAGLGFYGPQFIQTNRPCDPRWDFTQENADFVFGSIVAATGFIGTALGGLWLDHKAAKLTPDRRDNHIFAVVEPAWAIVWQVTLGAVICGGAAMMASPTGFFALLFLGEFLLFYFYAFYAWRDTLFALPCDPTI